MSLLSPQQEKKIRSLLKEHDESWAAHVAKYSDITDNLFAAIGLPKDEESELYDVFANYEPSDFDDIKRWAETEMRRCIVDQALLKFRETIKSAAVVLNESDIDAFRSLVEFPDSYDQ
jgi:hypothetical protein